MAAAAAARKWNKFHRNGHKKRKKTSPILGATPELIQTLEESFSALIKQQRLKSWGLVQV